jgi:NADH-quinone oxidoreductase subunit J
MLTQLLFYLFALVAVFSAGMTVSRRNPMASALWLVGTFFSLAAIYTLLGAFFIGIIQILVYAGAIMVLFLFVIMLLNLGNDFEPDFRGTVWKVTAAGSSLVLAALLVRMDYVVPLQVTGLLLLVAVVGAVVLAKRTI